jgi:23S rRNA pseudouridine1911/1915/1917 synthase
VAVLANMRETDRTRLDQAIAARFPEISRRKARELLARHRVLVNDRPVSVASRMVSPKDRIAIVDELPEIPILAMTEDWIAVDKPSGVPTQPVRERDRRSVEELLRLTLKRKQLGSEIFVIHRLDTATSGVLLLARTKAAARRLSEFFASGSMKKTYLAVVDGKLAGEFAVDTPIGRAGENRYEVSTEGKLAETIVRPLWSAEGVTLIETEITSGRTHQIRVHLTSIGHPVVGDRKYGPSSMRGPRLMLHAWKLGHTAIGEIVAPVPEDFRAFCARLGLPLADPRAPGSA